ncbi:MAG TPA: hypothetical protein PLG87_07310 [Treponemataceae bacterium]|nr:hypothetical protein [Treponemataceae bacterium]
MCKQIKFVVLVVLSILIFSFSLYGEVFTSDQYGYSIDFPEGFTIANASGEESYFFAHQSFPLSAVLRIYTDGRYTDVKTASDDSLKKLGASSDTNTFQWRNTACALSYFTMTMDNTKYEGWGFSSSLPSGRGMLFFMMYTPQENYAVYNKCILSSIDSICIDRGSFFESGPVTAFAYPPEGKKNVQLSIAGLTVPVTVDIIDAEAGEFVVEREFNVLTLYAGTALQERARQRYYQLIYRDAYGRLKKASFEISAVIGSKAQELNPSLPEFYTAASLLSWTQNFPYERNFSKSDFTHPVSALQGVGSDCDSRAMLLAILYRQMNIKAQFFLSTEYSHSVVGIDIPGKGARIDYEGRTYLLGETTAKVDLGLMAQDMSDSSKWFVIPLAE